MKKLAFILVLIIASMSIEAQESGDSLRLTIKDARAYALENNYQMQNARKDVLAAKKKVWEITASGLPQVNATVDYNNNLMVGTIPFTITDANGVASTSYIQMGTPHSMSAALTVSQLIFDGSYIVGLQSAITYKKISNLAEIKSETLVEEAVTNAYGNAVLSKATVEILQSNVKTLEDNLKQVEQFYKNGLTEEQNVEQIQILLSSSRNSLFNAERNRDISLQMLKYTLGLNLDQGIILENDIDFLLLENIDTLAVLNSQLNVENSIDFAIQENAVKSQELLKRLEQSKYLPSLTAFYQAKQDAFNDKFNFFNSNQNWYGAQVVGMRLTIPIFSSFERHSRVQQAKIELEKAKNNSLEIKQKLVLDFENAKSVYLSAVNNFFTSKQNMDLSSKIRKKEETKFFHGVSSSIDLLNAEQQMFQNQLNYIQSIQALIVSKAAMERLLREKSEDEQ